MDPARSNLNRLRDEATSRFMGQGGVVGVGINQENQLTILFSRPDPQLELTIRAWARQQRVDMDVIISGNLHAGAKALA